MKKIILIFSILLISAFTFKVKAQTLPAGYVKTTMVTGLNYPVAFDFAPDGRYFITQKGGNMAGSCANAKILVYSAAGALLSTFIDMTDSVNCDFERGLLGICLDPNFTTNHYVYAYYVHELGSANALRVIRFTEVANVATMGTILLNIDLNPYTVAGNHVGGNVHFRPSDPNRIYISIGDLAYHQGDSVINYANKLNKPFGKNLRINSDGTIPTSNPFYDDGNPATGNDDRIWSWGHRNPFDFCFSPISDTMYTSENGWNAWDELNVIHEGKNYGWAACEGNFIVTTGGATTT
ncbi:MAG: PQQ-dependent sugar dehydrogenase, partial [Bacteroidia bacterium]